MKCPWKDKNGCVNKCLMMILVFALSVLGLSILIKLISCLLDLFSYAYHLNTVIVIASVIIVLVTYSKYCAKSKIGCCDSKEKLQPDPLVKQQEESSDVKD